MATRGRPKKTYLVGVEQITRRRRRRIGKWDEYVTRMDTERLVKISRNNIPAGRGPPGRPKRWGDLIPD